VGVPTVTTSFDAPALLANVRAWGAELGFARIGVAGIDLSSDESRFVDWLREGFHGEMAYMSRHGLKRSRPGALVPGTVSCLSARMDYWPPGAAEAGEVLADPGAAYISRYALGRDYHRLMRLRLQKLCDKIAAAIGPFGHRAFVDSAPVLERSWAVRSGLGWVGKNGNVLTKNAGSFFFIATLITDLDLIADPPFITDHCGTCTRCIDECPTQAIVSPTEIDAGKCISYLTIELKDALIASEFHSKMNGWMFGCDICQDVCPWNRFSKENSESNFTPMPEILNLSLKEWETMTEETFNKTFKNSPLKRSKWKGIQRSIKAIKM